MFKFLLSRPCIDDRIMENCAVKHYSIYSLILYEITYTLTTGNGCCTVTRAHLICKSTLAVCVLLQAPTRRLLFREFIVYDHAKCYPEFLIEYQRC